MSDAGRADEHGITLADLPGEVVDVRFDGQRVFSAAPADFKPVNGGFHARWPAGLKPYLRGVTDLAVTTHLSGEVLLEQPLKLGGSRDRISVRDSQGRPLSVTKFGVVTRTFTDTDASTAHDLAANVARLTRDVNEFGVTAFVAFGSLLGAVRNGRLIGHDTDADIAYVSNHQHPTEVGLESFALERFLLSRGWGTERLRIGLLRAVFTDNSGEPQRIDIFTGVHDGARLMIDHFVWAELPMSSLEPLGTVTLEGVEIDAPHDPAALLTATYGPSYLVPDPSFKYEHTLAHDRASYAWLGFYRYRRGPWRRQLRQAAGTRGSRPSSLAQRVSKESSEAATVVDVGCGLGTDARWLAARRYRVLALDYVDAVTSSQRDESSPSPEFRRVSLYDTRQTLAAATRLAGEPGDLVVMARDLLDVLMPDGRTNFWLFCRTALIRRGRLYLEFRTRKRASGSGQPGFRPLKADRVVEQARAHGAHVISREDDKDRTVLVLGWAGNGA